MYDMVSNYFDSPTYLLNYIYKPILAVVSQYTRSWYDSTYLSRVAMKIE